MKRNDPNHSVAAAARSFAKRLPAQSRLGVVVFDSSVRLSVPLSSISDNGFTEQFDNGLRHIDYRGQWTDIPGAIERSTYELREHGRPNTRHAIILLTDGFADLGTEAKTAARVSWLFSSLVPEARRAQVTIYGIAFTNDADFSLIQTVSQQTGGSHYRILSTNEIDTVFQRISERVASSGVEVPRPPSSAEDSSRRSPVGSPPSLTKWGFLFVIALCMIGIGWVVVLRQRRPPVPATLTSCVDGRPYSVNRRVFRIGRVQYSRLLSNDLVIPQATVGRRHATIRYEKGAFYLFDNGSVNGTFLNNSIVAPNRAQQLKDRDLVRIDAFEYRFGAVEAAFARHAASIRTAPSDSPFVPSTNAAVPESQSLEARPIVGPAATQGSSSGPGDSTCLDCGRVVSAALMTRWREYSVCKNCEASALILSSTVAEEHARELAVKQKRRAPTLEVG